MTETKYLKKCDSDCLGIYVNGRCWICRRPNKTRVSENGGAKCIFTETKDRKLAVKKS